MKNIIMLIFVMFITYVVVGQERFVDGSMKIGSDIYLVNIHRERPIIGIRNLSKNAKEIPLPKFIDGYEPLPIRDKDVYVDTTKSKSIIMTVLKERLNQLKANRDYFDVSYIFAQDGSIMNISYILPRNTAITPREISIIDKKLRKEIRAVLTGIEYKAFPAIYYNRQKRIYF